MLIIIQAYYLLSIIKKFVQYELSKFVATLTIIDKKTQKGICFHRTKVVLANNCTCRQAGNVKDTRLNPRMTNATHSQHT